MYNHGYYNDPYRHHGYGYAYRNDHQNQYLFRDDCGKFSSVRFDQGLVIGKITRQEVDDLLHRVHKEVNYFKGNNNTCICCSIVAFLFFLLYIFNFIVNIDSDFFVVVLLVAIFGGIITIIVGIIIMTKN